jgi:hypothetical protein
MSAIDRSFPVTDVSVETVHGGTECDHAVAEQMQPHHGCTPLGRCANISGYI